MQITMQLTIIRCPQQLLNQVLIGAHTE